MLTGAIDYAPQVPRLSPKWPVLLGVLLVLGLSFLARYAQGVDYELPGVKGWITSEADSHYHMRRVDRALTEGFVVAGSDGYLNYPEGSAIPWPPYYTYIAGAILAPFAPTEAVARRRFVEQGMASLPIFFGVLTSLLAALAGAQIAGRRGALVAGCYHALCHISIMYSNLGNGDHHSFVSFASAALLLVVSWLLCKRRLDKRRTALLGGALTGVLLGVLLGSWLGAMVLLIALELVLAYLIFRQNRDPLKALATFGFTLHLVALLTLMPAVVASPWTALEPWMLVNLSYFHPTFLALGALVFLPLFWMRSRSPALGRYPWIVGLVLALLGVLIAFSDLPLSASVREGFAWASKSNRFMASIAESRSLFAADASPGPSLELGFAFWLYPLVLLAALHSILRRAKLELLPFVAFGLLTALGASQQARFGESLALPLAVLLGWAASRLMETRRLQQVPRAALLTGVLVLVFASNWTSSARTLKPLFEGRPDPLENETPARLGTRQAANWIRKHAAPAGDYSVLADWSLGHTLEWVAERPTVATNFGSYVGQDGFRAPAQFFMEEDPARAEALLVKRKARYVLLNSDLPDHLNSMIERAAPERRERWIQPGTEGQVAPAWFQTMGARLMFDGTVFQGQPRPQLDFLRLVYLSPITDPGRRLRGPNDLSPAALLWEHVKGAQVQCAGQVGETLTIEIDLRYPRASRSLKWRASAQADSTGRASLRVPYATLGPNGAGQVSRALWSMGQASGPLAIPETAVQAGATLTLRRRP